MGSQPAEGAVLAISDGFSAAANQVHKIGDQRSSY